MPRIAALFAGYCNSCGCNGPLGYTEAEAVAAWNTRAKEKLSVSIAPFNSDKGFAAYLAGSINEDEAQVVLNIEGFLHCVEDGTITASEMPYYIAESIMHEVIHALEDWARVEFSEDRVEAVIAAYRERHPQGESTNANP